MSKKKEAKGHHLDRLTVNHLTIGEGTKCPITFGHKDGITYGCFGGELGSAAVEITVQDDGDLIPCVTVRRVASDGTILGTATFDPFALTVNDTEIGGAITYDLDGVTRRHPTKGDEDRELYRRAD